MQSLMRSPVPARGMPQQASLIALTNSWSRAHGKTCDDAFRSQRRNTTILCVRKDNKVVMCGDGLVTAGHYKVKPNALKVRTIGKGKNLCMTGFAGGTADCLALLERLEMKLEEYPGQLVRASVELAKAWRLDKMLRQLNATVIVANAEATLELTGNGDCFEPHDGVLGIGSGGAFATAAARALVESGVALDAREIAVRACTIASDLDTATNARFTIEEIDVTKLSPAAASEENAPGGTDGTESQEDGEKATATSATASASSGGQPNMGRASSTLPLSSATVGTGLYPRGSVEDFCGRYCRGVPELNQKDAIMTL
ncbi:unnamed protein product [Amoebophrya sp. A25]|nr:unnamed protein product [Amoebophrya sp. A25]|eukprot:GSA25T00007589001.1